MERVLKWITLAAAAAALAFGGATLAGDLLERNDPANSTLTADQPSATEPLENTKQTIAAPVPAKDEPFVIKRILPIDGPIKYGEWHWDEDGVPAGPLVMTVDLEARVLSVFRNGYEIGATAVLLGTQDHPTPLGSFPILQKKRDNVSSIYGAAMPYTLRLTWDGISIHGSPVENGFASHGCIGTPNEFAAKLFAVASKGDTVIITRGKMIGMGDSII
ncbi:L,D-transpeptidase family protein [Altererythrobacter confluentis]|uniref:L,D-transpeptidase family protein n=1 Tax=Allopontixanthobacter confluentis TaxID=1849021 RepID=A0A6L7GB48_9SPHN|nr:L,D-transpeptidase family protein [Allopontixanthobacter confluentis]MXP13302.1 L,D-transpeptidase family protein [Allopontixanthobacter confluentis]